MIDPTDDAKYGKRRSEFTQGRTCLHGLLEQFGETGQVGAAPDRSPVWPNGFVGSLSHSDAWVWGCVAQSRDLISIGIDTECVASTKVCADVQETIATDLEWHLGDKFGLLPEVAFTLFFSAKEAFYKCWYPLVKTYFDFLDAQVVALDSSTLTLKTLLPHPGFESGPGTLKVHYLVDRSNVFTATWIEQKGAI